MMNRNWRPLGILGLALATLIGAGLLLPLRDVGWSQSAPPAATLRGTLQNAAQANGNGTPLNVAVADFGMAVVTYVVSGTFTATVNFEATQDTSNWTALTCYPLSGGTPVSSATAPGAWRCNLGGAFQQVRARISGYSSGAVTVTATASYTGQASLGSTPLERLVSKIATTPGLPTVNNGDWTLNNVLTPNRLLVAGANNTVASFPGLTYDGSNLTLGTGTGLLSERSGVLAPHTSIVPLAAYADLPTALTAIGSNAATLLIDAPTTVTANVTVPANVTLWFAGNGLLDPAPGVTVTINGPVLAELNQIFSRNGFVKFGLAGNVSRVYPQWWGAISDGVTDSTAAVQYAVYGTAFSTASSNSGSGAYSGSGPTLWFPHGRYVINQNIGALAGSINYLELAGEEAIIELGSGATFLAGIAYQVYIHNLTIRGGATGLAIATNNVDTTQIRVDNCEFISQTVAAITSDSTSNSTELVITRVKIHLTQSGAKALVLGSGDWVIFSDSWVSVSVPATTVFDVTNNNFLLQRTVLVDGSGQQSWVTLHGGRLLAREVSFGGHSGGVTGAIVRAGTSATDIAPLFISMDRCELRTSTTGAIIQFFRLPSEGVVLTNNVGVRAVSGPYFVFDPTIPTSDLSAFGSAVWRIYDNHEHNGGLGPAIGAPAALYQGMPANTESVYRSTVLPDVADLVIQSQGWTGGYGQETSVEFATLAVASDIYGVSSAAITGTADNGNATIRYTTALSGLASGVYTAVYEVTVSTAASATIIMQASTYTREYVLSRGRHLLELPFYFDGTNQLIGVMVVYIPNGATVTWNRWRVYAGRVNIHSRNAQVVGTSPPSAGQWYVGDVVWNATPQVLGTAGSQYVITGWTCRAAGTPGTWTPMRTLTGS